MNIKPDGYEGYEYKVIEWRSFQEEYVIKEIDDLIEQGWEKDGPTRIKAGFSVDLYMQSLRRKLNATP